MTISPGFYRGVAVCSIVSAITTLGLIYLPEFYQPVEGFEGRMRRVDDPAYALRSWVYLVHPFITFAAALGVALRIRTLRSVAAIVGVAGFALWASNEALQQTMTLFAFDKWRVAYATADELTRAQIRIQTAVYDGLWDALYFLLLCGFAISHLALGQAMVRCKGLTRTVGVLLLLAFVLTLSYMLNELSLAFIPGAIADRLELFLQPVGRTVIGVWLWKMAHENEPLR